MRTSGIADYYNLLRSTQSLVVLMYSYGVTLRTIKRHSTLSFSFPNIQDRAQECLECRLRDEDEGSGSLLEDIEHLSFDASFFIRALRRTCFTL